MYPTLSEAIILGSLETEQAYRVYWQGGKTCAMGAAWSSINGLIPNFRGDAYDRYAVVGGVVPLQWKWAWVHKVVCPVCSLSGRGVVSMIIMHLNDTHKWARPRIAQWVAEQEALLTQSPVSTQEVCLNESRS